MESRMHYIVDEIATARAEAVVADNLNELVPYLSDSDQKAALVALIIDMGPTLKYPEEKMLELVLARSPPYGITREEIRAGVELYLKEMCKHPNPAVFESNLRQHFA